MSCNELLSLALRSFGALPADDIPPGWATAEQWAADCSMSREQAGRYLRAGMRLGNVDVRKFRIAANKPPTPHYRIVDTPGAS
jgi:hypothetical protein